MKKLLVAVFILLSMAGSAQNQNLVIEGSAPNLYLTHIVAAKEGLYSIGRLYNQTPKLIASFNGLTMDKGLTIGQSIKIPLNSLNYDLAGNTVAGETLVPLYHVVGKNETLFRISNNHSAKVEAVKEWNHLSSDVIEPGKPLVIGHLRVKNDQLAAFNAIVMANAQTLASNEAKPATTPVVKEGIAEQERQPQPQAVAVKEEKKQEPVKTEDALQKDTPVVAEKKAEAQPTVQQEKAVEIKDTAVKATAKEDVPSKPTESEKVVAIQTTTDTKAITTNNAATIATEPSSPFNEAGVFASLYVDGREGVVNKTGEAATFKSTSGWQDKKYYVLINNVEPGTIVKVSAADKTVYAKVLGGMPDMKENNGLLMRISNAAASYLGIFDPKFAVQISY